MTLLGKIFTVLIFIMSIFYMALAVGVYATHRNWRDEVLRPRDKVTGNQEIGLKYQLEDAQKINQDLRNLRDKLQNELAMEKAARRQALAALEARVQDLQNQLVQKEQRNATLVESERQAIAAMDTTQRNLDGLRAEVEGLRAEIRDAQQARQDVVTQVVSLTDQLQQAQGIERRLNERRDQLADELSRAKAVLARNNLDINAPIGNVPPLVDGVVLAVGDRELIEISIGSDDGLKVGHYLDVFRDRSYLGRVVVRRTAPDRAVAEIIPIYKKGQIQKGDRVATKIG